MGTNAGRYGNRGSGIGVRRILGGQLSDGEEKAMKSGGGRVVFVQISVRPNPRAEKARDFVIQ